VPLHPDQPRNLNHCPNCNLIFEIAAVDLSIVSGNIVLFVCPSCGLANPESRTEAPRKARMRIAELDRLLRWLKARRYAAEHPGIANGSKLPRAADLEVGSNARQSWRHENRDR
jgi:hypothetical protein